MSGLLNEIIAARKAKAIDYEEYLKHIADLAKNVQAGQSADTLEALKNSPGMRALYNNLKDRGGKVQDTTASYEQLPDASLSLAIRIDEAVKHIRPDGWRGVQAREQVIKAALYEILRDPADVERIFLIVKQQKEY
jgi:type I restriction enzyme, R subunit